MKNTKLALSPESRSVYKQLNTSLQACRLLVEEKKEWLSEEELSHCASEMVRVAGALDILANRTPALLAKEASMAFKLAKNKDSTNKTTALMMAASSVSVLLESMEDKVVTADANYRLLSVINKLRGLRDEKPMPASEVYSIDLEVVPVNQNLEATASNFAAVAESQGPKLQAALLAWYQDCQNPGSINALVEIADKLRLAASERPHIQFFEVIAALIDSQRGCAHVNQSIRLLLAHVERYVRQLSAVDSVQGYVPTAITKEALYHIAANAYQRSERVLGILGRYGLRDRRSRKREKDNDLGAGPGLLDEGLVKVKNESSDQALRECRKELALLEKAIEKWLKQDEQDVLLNNAHERLHRVRRCFDLLGLSKQAEISKGLQDILFAMQDGNIPENFVCDVLPQFAETVVALSGSIDIETNADNAMPVPADGLLNIAEQSLKGIDLFRNETAQQDIVPEVSIETSAETHEVADGESVSVSDFIEDTENLLGDFDSLLETSDLLSLPDEEIVESGSGDGVSAQPGTDLIAGFVEEATDLLKEMQQQLAIWRSHSDEQEPVNAVLRLLHTLKGAARVAGYTKLGDLSHGLESTLSSTLSGTLPVTPALVESTHQSLHAMQRMVMQGTEDELPGDLHEKPGVVEEAEFQPPYLTTPPFEVEQRSDAGLGLSENQLRRMIQLNAESLLGQSELSEEALSAMSAVLELDPIIHRLSQELDDSGVSKDSQVRLSEAVNDLRLAANQVLRRVDGIEKRLDNLFDSTATLRQSLAGSKMIAIESEVVAYRSLIEQTSKQLDKKVSMRTSGLGLWLDRKVLPIVSAALGHLIRNAIDHGIELESLHSNAGKPATAMISIECNVGIDGINISVVDDGAGIDVRAVWRKAVSKQLIDSTEQFDENKAYRLLFDHSFSTKNLVTQVSGRGVGLDAVKADITRLGGEVSVESELGRGSRFTLSLPYQFGMVPVSVVKVGDQYFGLPGLSDRIVVEVDHLEPELMFDDKHYRVINLAEQLSVSSGYVDGQSMQALLFDYKNLAYALVVSRVEGIEKISVDPVGVQLQEAGYLSGIGLLHEGKLLPVLKPSYFLRDGECTQLSSSSVVSESVALSSHTILVVDDSLTTRRYCESLLQSQGYRVIVAKSAEEALEVAGKAKIDLLVTDLQLPKMDGYQLIDGLHRFPRYQDIPIILISATPSDMTMMSQYNIAVWLSKPYKEQEFFAAIESLVENRLDES